ncbi:MAG: hypothetical protein KF878_12075 [Planctomycetes bacterium]|nr:hypothetical protein [Planctomycetota bacterium]
MHFEDGSPYTYFAPGPGEPPARSVGWLEEGHPFTIGRLPTGVLDRIAWRCAFATTHQTRGIHRCSLCPRDAYDAERECYLLVRGERPRLLGTREVWIPGPRGVIYAAPDLVVHYLVDHAYLPPPDFVEAALRLEDALPFGWSVAFLTRAEVKARW